MSSEVSTRRLIAATMLLALAFTSLIQTGCTRPIRRLGIMDELAIAYRDRVWAQRAYNLRFANCNREYSDHFKSGFCSGYSDVCNGGDGYIPALPPEEYRGYEYQCAEGSKCVDTWFEGYPAGVAAAREEKAGSFHQMHVSRMIDQAITQDKATNVLPSDVPVTKSSATMIPPTSSVVTKKLGEQMVPPKPPMALRNPEPMQMPYASTKPGTPVAHSVLAKPATMNSATVKPAPVAPQRSAKVPPIYQAPAKPQASPQQLPPIKSIEKPAQTSLPPIVQGTQKVTTTVKRPPIVRGRKIDPSASVSVNEIPLPMTVRSSFDTRTAAWPVNRK
ncbi:hypothetical protein [Mariniblastus fucicola]|uniref:Uncharacterized protein n=1 Tax=Mariniblastus fucicola TaxID=980251 RepID=A0A5B9PCG7_9BACT|nr:hypothetical protein [Mariniblastus fucicola]QEG22855.1 hypothetical protein MFFC18_27410 [Mariniblastus fucicola]